MRRLAAALAYCSQLSCSPSEVQAATPANADPTLGGDNTHDNPASDDDVRAEVAEFLSQEGVQGPPPSPPPPSLSLLTLCLPPQPLALSPPFVLNFKELEAWRLPCLWFTLGGSRM